MVDLIAQSRVEPDRARSGMITPVLGQSAPGAPNGPSSASKLVQETFMKEILLSWRSKVDRSLPWKASSVRRLRAILLSTLHLRMKSCRMRKSTIRCRTHLIEWPVTFYINNKSLVIHPVLQVARPGYFKCGRQLGWPYTYQTV